MADKTRKKRQEIDPVFKNVFESEWASYQASVQTQYEVGRLPRTIDVLVTIEEKDELDRICNETPFFYFLRTNQVEFKGKRDPLTVDDYHAIRGRIEFLLCQKGISSFDTTVTIISAGKPKTALDYTTKLEKAFIPIEGNLGYYKCDECPPLYLIVINELSLIPKNYPLLIFASSTRKFRKFLEQVIAEGESTYIRYAYEVRPQVTKEVLIMAGIPSSLTREDLEFMAQDIGPEMIAIMKPEDVLKSMDVEKRKKLLLSLLSLEDLFSGMSLENLLNEMGAMNRKKLFELLLKLGASDPVDKDEQNSNK